jgi:hypothetical protein
VPLLGLLLEELELGLVELDEPPMLPLLELPMLPPELVPPVELELPCSFFWWASHSERLIWPSWLVSISLNSSLPDFEDEEPPAAALLPEGEDEVPPADDDVPLDDGVLLCDIEGDELELDLFFVASSA